MRHHDPEPNPSDALVVRRCKALGSPVRLAILRYVRAHPGCIANEIWLHLPSDGPHAQSTISQHLRVLREAELVEAWGEGAAVCYTINDQALHSLRELLQL